MAHAPSRIAELLGVILHARWGGATEAEVAPAVAELLAECDRVQTHKLPAVPRGQIVPFPKRPITEEPHG
jgi:hypothetical protein